MDGVVPGKESIDKEGLSILKKIRQNMEKVRLLLELIRKREKLKTELIKCHEATVDLRLNPLGLLLQHTLEQLQAKDPTEIFADPVSIIEVQYT